MSRWSSRLEASFAVVAARMKVADRFCEDDLRRLRAARRGRAMTHEWSTTTATHLLVEERCPRCQLRRWRAPAGSWLFGIGDGHWEREAPACTGAAKATDPGPAQESDAD